MSALSTLLDDLSTFISQTSTSNLTDTERVRYLDISRKGVANKHDWRFLDKEADLSVTLKGTDNLYSTASLPSDIKSYKIRSIFYAPDETEFVGVDENMFMRDDVKMYTLGRTSSTLQIRLKNVDGADADADAYLADQALSASVTTAVTSFLTAPDVPRPVLFTPGGTTANIAAGNIVVVGTDGLGDALTENVAITNGMTASVASTGSFRTITSITFPIMSGAGVTFDVGTNSTVGLKIRYLANLTAYSTSDLTATTGFPDEMDETIVLGAVYRIFMKFNRSEQQISNYKNEYLEALTESWSLYGRAMKAQPDRIVNSRAMSHTPISSKRY